MGHDPKTTELSDGADTLRQVPVWRFRDGVSSVSEDVLAVETPVALEFNGISHAVMLASPADLEDFALGFSLTEGIVGEPSQFYGCEIEATAEGCLVHIDIATECFLKLKERRRNLTGRTGCGLCGTEALDQVVRPFPPVLHRHGVDPSQLIVGMRAMHSLQPLQQQSGATHAAAWMNEAGEVVCVREDVGRHNALDKLVGRAFFAGELPLRDKILLVSGRVSFELMQKALAAGIPVVAAISAPTSAAVEFARESGQVLAGFVRGARMNVYAGTLAE